MAAFRCASSLPSTSSDPPPARDREGHDGAQHGQRLPGGAGAAVLPVEQPADDHLRRLVADWRDDGGPAPGLLLDDMGEVLRP